MLELFSVIVHPLTLKLLSWSSSIIFSDSASYCFWKDEIEKVILTVSYSFMD